VVGSYYKKKQRDHQSSHGIETGKKEAQCRPRKRWLDVVEEDLKALEV